MSSVGAPRHDPVPIGVTAEPPFAKTPDPATLFAARAERFRTLADGHVLAPYLRFLASLSDVQHRLQDGLPVPVTTPSHDRRGPLVCGAVRGVAIHP